MAAQPAASAAMPRGPALALALVSLALGPQAFGDASPAADSPAPPAPPVAAEESSLDLRSPTPRARSARSGEVWDSAALEAAQPRQIGDALEAAAGVFIQRPRRGVGDFALRGIGGPRTLLLLDGVRLNTAHLRGGVGRLLGNLDPFGVARIELLRGPAGVPLGEGALSGALQLHTAGPTGRAVPGFNAGMLGRFGLADAAVGGSAYVDGGSADYSARVAGSFRDLGALRSGNGETLPSSDYSHGGYRAHLRAQLPAGWQLQGSWLDHRSWDQAATDRLPQGELRYHTLADQLASLRLSGPGVGFLSQVDIALSWHRAEDRVDRNLCRRNPDTGLVSNGPACARNEEAALTQRSREAERVQSAGMRTAAQTRLFGDRLRLVYGLDLAWDFIEARAWDSQGEADRRLRPLTESRLPDDAQWRSIGAYALARGRIWRFGSGWEIGATLGVRLIDVQATAPSSALRERLDAQFTRLVSRASVNAALDERLSIYASYAGGLRAPNLQELAGRSDVGPFVELPAPALAPETSHGFELGARLALREVALPFRAEAAGFVTLIEDPIDLRPAALLVDGETPVSVVDGRPVASHINARRAFYRGVELRIRLGPIFDLMLDTSLSWVRGDIEDPARLGGEEQPARTVPPLFGRSALRYAPWDGRLSFTAALRWANNQDRLHVMDRASLALCEDRETPGRLAEACEGTEGWYALDFGVNYRLGRTLRINALARNVTDQSYRSHGSAYDAEGYDLRVALGVDW